MSQNHPIKIICTMFLAMTLIVIGDAAGKSLTAAGFSPFFTAWIRFALAAVVLLPFSGLVRSEIRYLFNWRIIVRACLIAAAICSILTALKTEPIANVFGGFFYRADDFVFPVGYHFERKNVTTQHGYPLDSLHIIRGRKLVNKRCFYANLSTAIN